MKTQEWKNNFPLQFIFKWHFDKSSYFKIPGKLFKLGTFKLPEVPKVLIFYTHSFL